MVQIYARMEDDIMYYKFEEGINFKRCIDQKLWRDKVGKKVFLATAFNRSTHGPQRSTSRCFVTYFWLLPSIDRPIGPQRSTSRSKMLKIRCCCVPFHINWLVIQFQEEDHFLPNSQEFSPTFLSFFSIFFNHKIHQKLFLH